MRKWNLFDAQMYTQKMDAEMRKNLCMESMNNVVVIRDYNNLQYGIEFNLKDMNVFFPLVTEDEDERFMEIYKKHDLQASNKDDDLLIEVVHEYTDLFFDKESVPAAVNLLSIIAPVYFISDEQLSEKFYMLLDFLLAKRNPAGLYYEGLRRYFLSDNFEANSLNLLVELVSCENIYAELFFYDNIRFIEKMHDEYSVIIERGKNEKRKFKND